MNVVALALSVAAITTAVALVTLTALAICIRTGGRYLTSDAIAHSRIENAARRICGVHVQRPEEITYDDTRR